VIDVLLELALEVVTWAKVPLVLFVIVFLLWVAWSMA
jgi:hypothetical protein